MLNKFRDPVFVRNDDTTNISASVVEWCDGVSGFSIHLEGGDHSVLINVSDWDVIKQCIDRELNRVGAFDAPALIGAGA